MVGIRKKIRRIRHHGYPSKDEWKKSGQCGQTVGRWCFKYALYMSYICLIYIISILYLYYIYALSMLYLCFIYVSCIEHVCIIYALSMKQQRSNGRADVPQGGKAQRTDWWRGWRDGGMEGMVGKYVRGIFSEGERNHWRGIPKSIYYILKEYCKMVIGGSIYESR